MNRRRDISVLIVEDSDDDARLEVAALRRAGYEVRWRRVQDEAGMRAALHETRWDVVLCDHRMPAFDSLRALRVLRAGEADIPLILVSGAIGEEAAVSVVRAGATDYVSKDGLSRLGQTVALQLNEAENLRMRRRTDEALRESRERFEQAFENAPIGMALLNLEGEWTRVNRTFSRITGYPPEKLVGHSFAEITHPDDVEPDRDRRRRLIAGEIDDYRMDKRYLSPTGDPVWVSLSVSLVHGADGHPAYFINQIEDVTASRRAEAALRRSEAQMRAMLESAPDAMVIVEGSGVIALVNAQTEALFGYSREEMIGQSVGLFIPASLRAQHARHVEAYFAAARSRPMGTGLELTACRRDGTTFPAEISLSPVDLDQVTAVSASVRDVSGRQRAEDELRAARDAALAASRLKSAFVANVSHEIRTPLNGVVALADLLAETDLTSSQQEYVDGLRASAEALMSVIGEILDFSKIEAGRLDVDLDDVDIRVLVDDVCASAAGTASAKGIELIASVHPAVPAVVRTDPARVRQVLSNLIGNATKFTERGEVVVRVTPERPSSRSALRFEVSDTGIGVAAGDQAKVFESFAQADSATTRQYGGTGLGLTISKRLVEALGGSIGLQSAVGRGSTFHFTLPCEAAVTPDWPEHLVDFSGLQALAFDPNPAQRDALHDRLVTLRLSCTTADREAEVLSALGSAAAERRPFDLVFVPADQPDGRGPQLARLIRADTRLRASRLIALVHANAQDAVRREGLFDALVPVPVRQSPLLDAIVELTGSTRVPTSEVAQPTPGQGGAAPRLMHVLVAEDNQINQLAAVHLLQKCGCHVELARDGREAVQMCEAGVYDGVFMDCQMPNLDGYQATEEIRRREPRGRHVPIIAMTANAMKGDREKCLAAGMDDHIAKPMRIASVRKAVARMRAEAASRDEAAMRPAALAPGSAALDPAAPTLNPAPLADLDDPAVKREIAALFVGETATWLRDLDMAVDADDPQRLRWLTHGIKGAAATVGATALRDACELVYEMAVDGITGEVAGLCRELELELARATDALLAQAEEA